MLGLFDRKKKGHFRSVHEVQQKVKRELAELKGESHISLPDSETQAQIAREIANYEAKEKQRLAKLREETILKTQNSTISIPAKNFSSNTEEKTPVKPQKNKRKLYNSFWQEIQDNFFYRKPNKNKTKIKTKETASFSRSYKDSVFNAPTVSDIEESPVRKKVDSESKVNKTYGDYTPPPIYVPLSRRSQEEKQTSRSSRYRILPMGSQPIDYILQLPLVLRRLFVDLRDPIPVLDKILFFAVFIVAYFVAVLGIVMHYKYVKPDESLIIQSGGKRIEIVVKKEDIPFLKRTLGPNWLEILGQRHLNTNDKP